jgi:thymidylate synthase ThyX
MVEIIGYTSNALGEILEVAGNVYPRAKLNRDNRDDQKRMINMCIRDGEVSIFSHATAKIDIICSHYVSQELSVITNDLTIKTNVNTDYSNLSFITPDEFSTNDKLKLTYMEYIKYITKSINELYSIDNTIDYRCILPASMEVEVIITTNFLNLLRILKVMNYKNTSPELINICGLLYEKLNNICDIVFNKTNLKLKI